MRLQYQWNKIHRFFKTTSEPYDHLDWDGDTLHVWLNDDIIETYSYNDLCEIIEDFIPED